MFSQEEVLNTTQEFGCQVGVASNRSKAVYAPSLGAYLNWLEGACPTPQKGKSSDSRGRGDFQAFDSYATAFDTYRNRPHDVCQFEEITSQLVSINNAGNAVDYEVVGDYVDIGRFLDGEPEHWGYAQLGNPRGLIATIYFNTVTPWYVDQEILVRRGQQMVALVDWLEAQQIRTSMRAVTHNDCALAEIVVKEYHDPVDLNPIAVTGHPDFLRRMIFRHMEYSPTWSSGYGSGIVKIKGEERGLTVIAQHHESVEAVDEFFNRVRAELAEKIEAGIDSCTIE